MAYGKPFHRPLQRAPGTVLLAGRVINCRVNPPCCNGNLDEGHDMRFRSDVRIEQPQHRPVSRVSPRLLACHPVWSAKDMRQRPRPARFKARHYNPNESITLGAKPG